MIIISGCPRSGTSLMMDILRTCLGDDRIIAEKFPKENKVEFSDEAREYAKSKLNQDYKDLNPNGFYEMGWSVRGVQYTPEFSDLFEKIENADKPYFCKVVSQGLYKTAPVFVDKVIYMLRAPSEVATSQQRLNRDGTMMEGIPVHSVTMFNRVTYMAAKWFVANQSVPVEIVRHEQLLAAPDSAIEKISYFIGEPLTEGKAVVDQKLYRSRDKKIPLDDSNLAEKIYKFACEKKWQEIVDLFEIREPVDKPVNCTRIMRECPKALCDICMKERDTVKNLMKTAARQGIDWSKEPCLRE
jgi:hypothetical protein